jgi:hypothetical protein
MSSLDWEWSWATDGAGSNASLSSLRQTVASSSPIPGSLALAVRLLACLTALDGPEYYSSDADLPINALFSLYERDALFAEADELLNEAVRSWKVVDKLAHVPWSPVFAQKRREHEGVRDIVIKVHYSPRYRRRVYYTEVRSTFTCPRLYYITKRALRVRTRSTRKMTEIEPVWNWGYSNIFWK